MNRYGIPEPILEDFRNHMAVCFKAMGLDPPTKAQYAIGEALQYGPSDMQLQAGRGFGKSVITACLTTWWLARDPETTIMVVSASADKAMEFVSMVRTQLELVPYLKHLIPKKEDKDNLFGFDVGCKQKVTQNPSVIARGITAQLTGKHSEYLIFDDVEVENNSNSEVQRDKLLRRVLEAEQIRNQGGRIIFLGTPQTEDSIYNKFKDVYPTVKFPAEIPDRSDPMDCDCVAPWVMQLEGNAGDPTQPERFPRNVLDERLAKIGPRLYALNYKLQTALADQNKYPLKLRDLIVLDLDRNMLPAEIVWQGQAPATGVKNFGMAGDWLCEPMYVGKEFIPPQYIGAFVDPSGRGEDETVCVIAAALNGRVYILDIKAWNEGYEDTTLMGIINLAAKYRVKEIVCEDNMGDGMFTRLLQVKAGIFIPGIGITGKKVGIMMKERRILDALEPLFSNHKVIIDRQAISEEKTQRQITRMCRVKGALAHDDRVDALAFACEHMKGFFMSDPEMDLKSYQEREMTKMLERFEGNPRLMPGEYGLSGCLKHLDPPQTPKQRPSPWSLFNNNKRRGI